MKRTIDDRFDAVVWGGLFGGAAEVVVVTLAALLAGIGGWAVASGVSDAVYPAAFQGGDAIVVGLTVHFVLSFLIAACFVPIAARIQGRFGALGVVAASAAALSGVWAMNFFVVLPRVAPEFVTIVPLEVSFLSKLSFGVVMGLTLVSRSRVNGSRRRTPA
jgi:hypothetical protein